jgi:hypothetical protein
MDVRTNLYRIVSIAAMMLALGSIISFALMQYRIAWGLVVALVVCAEVRVQLKGRLPRARLMWIHLAAAIPFLMVLTTLAFFFVNGWIELMTALLGIVVLITGTMLWYRGMRTLNVSS